MPRSSQYSVHVIPFSSTHLAPLLIGFLGTMFALALLIVPGTTWGASSSIANPHQPSAPDAPPSGIIGVALQITAHTIGDPAKLYIRAIHPEGPAAKAGLNHGQEILKVDDTPLSGKTYQEVVSMIRGVANTSVSLTIDGPNGIRTVKIMRVDQEVLLEKKHRT
ncbi:MAG: PDZ domain-containing protein [Nitrospirae bacterium]|nr:PDZ domain-containing protein [Nitrospirota bacterium]